jgi:Bacterial membrane protein YfhO
MRRRFAALTWPLLAGLGAVFPLTAVLLAGRTLVWRDTAQLYAPHRGVIVEALRAFRLPAWNPWEGTGQPLLAQGLHAVLHPVSMALAFLTPSMDALLVALVLFAAVGAWLAARELDCTPAASAAAALAFALSGYVLGMTANVVFLVGSATGPWVVAGLLTAARRPRGWLAAAAAVAALALSGDAGSLAALTLAGAVLAWSFGGRGGLLRAAAGSALGVALAAVQLVPSWASLAETSRGAGLLDPASLHRWALSPWRLVELVAPGFFVGRPERYLAPVFAALAGDGLDRFPFAPSVFVGAPVLLLAALGARRAAAGRWLLGLAGLFLWLALGHHAGSQELLSGVPVWGVLRYWEKMVGPLTLCLALAAGLGADALAELPPRTIWRWLGAGGGLTIVAVLLATALLGASDGRSPEVEFLARAQLAAGSIHVVVGLLALWGVIWLVRPRWPGLLPAALAALVFLQSLAAAPYALHAGDASVASVRPPVPAAAPPGPRLVSPLGFDLAEGRGGLDAIDLLQVGEARLARPSTNVAARVDALATYTGLTSLRWDMVLGSGPLFWPLSRRFATTHVLARPPISRPEAEALEAATAGATSFTRLDGGEVLLWEVPHRDWASFAPSVVTATGLEQAGALLGQVVEAGQPTVVLETALAPSVSPGRVLSLRRAPEEVVVEAESTSDAVLVVNDAWAPGWRAMIDGRNADVMPADVLVRAVRWPAGRHTLVMTYRPPGLAAGQMVSAVALVLALAGLLWQRPRRPS